MQDDSLEAFQRHLRAKIDAQNNAPKDDFLGLSPIQMMGVNYQPLQEGCVLRWHDNIDDSTLARVPLLTLAVNLLQQLEAKPMKLTPKGNLPRKVVQELYATGLIPQDDIEAGITKLSSEDDYHAAITLKHLLNQLGWTKKRQGKLSLTAKGKKILAGSRQTMLEQLFLNHFSKFNIAYFDGYKEGRMQQFFGFLLVALLLKGTEFRPIKEYSTMLLRAFPMLIEDYPGDRWHTPEKKFAHAVAIRFFDRSLSFYGLLRFKQENPTWRRKNDDVMATDVLRGLFGLI